MSDISDELADLVKLAQDMERVQQACPHTEFRLIVGQIIPGMNSWKCLECGQMRSIDPGIAALASHHAMDPKDYAQAELAKQPEKSGQIYRHYKGSLYTIVAMAIMEDTLTPMVVYQSNAKGTISIRTLANWREWVLLQSEGVGSHERPRFDRETD